MRGHIVRGHREVCQESLRQEGKAASGRTRCHHHRPDSGRRRSSRGGKAGSAARAPGQCVVVAAGRRADEQPRSSRAECGRAQGLVGRCRDRLLLQRALERRAAGRRRQGLHARCRGNGVGLLHGERRAGLVSGRDPRQREEQGRLRRRACSRRRAALRGDRLWHRRCPRSRQWRGGLDQARWRAGPQRADRRGRQDLFRFRGQHALCPQRR